MQHQAGTIHWHMAIFYVKCAKQKLNASNRYIQNKLLIVSKVPREGCKPQYLTIKIRKHFKRCFCFEPWPSHKHAYKSMRLKLDCQIVFVSTYAHAYDLLTNSCNYFSENKGGNLRLRSKIWKDLLNRKLLKRNKKTLSSVRNADFIKHPFTQRRMYLHKETRCIFLLVLFYGLLQNLCMGFVWITNVWKLQECSLKDWPDLSMNYLQSNHLWIT